MIPKDVPEYRWHPFRDVWKQAIDKLVACPFGGRHLEKWTDTGVLLHWPAQYPDCTSRQAMLPHWKSTILMPTIFTSVDPRNQEKIQTQFFILRCIIHHWWSIVVDKDMVSDETYSLTTQKWRDILHGSYWKAQWPVQGTRFNLEVDPTFQVLEFWKYGDPLIFKGEPHPELLKQRPLLEGGTPLEPHHFKSDQLKEFVLLDLRVTHMQFVLKSVDQALVSGLSGQELDRHRSNHDLLFRRGPNLLLLTPAWESEDNIVRQMWFVKFCDMMKH
jgi:hypothetical protein